MSEPAVFDCSSFPVLNTERLVLRELCPSDVADVLLFRGDPIVQKYNSEPLKNLCEAEAFIQENLAEFSARKSIPWAMSLRESGRVIGTIGLFDWNRYHRRAMFGYDMARDCWGHGYATEAGRAVIRFGYDRLNLNRLDADTIADNWPSVRLLARLGFTREGIRRAYSWEEDGTFHDGSINRLLREEFEK